MLAIFLTSWICASKQTFFSASSVHCLNSDELLKTKQKVFSIVSFLQRFSLFNFWLESQSTNITSELIGHEARYFVCRCDFTAICLRDITLLCFTCREKKPSNAVSIPVGIYTNLWKKFFTTQNCLVFLNSGTKLGI